MLATVLRTVLSAFPDSFTVQIYQGVEYIKHSLIINNTKELDGRIKQ